MEGITKEDYHVIKKDGSELRLFKSVTNRRLTEFDETFGEYRVRNKIMKKLIKEQRKGTYSKDKNPLQKVTV